MSDQIFNATRQLSHIEAAPYIYIYIYPGKAQNYEKQTSQRFLEDNQCNDKKHQDNDNDKTPFERLNINLFDDETEFLNNVKLKS